MKHNRVLQPIAAQGARPHSCLHSLFPINCREVALGTALFLLGNPLQAAAEGLLEYHASYVASANGIAATAERSLTQLENQSYALLSRLEASVAGVEIANLRQFSEITLTDNQIVPQRYNYRVRGVGSDLQEVYFDWENGTAISSEDDESWVIELAPNTLDELSYQLALRQQLSSVEWAVNQELVFAVIDGDDIETMRYLLAGEELLDTPLGVLNCLRLERLRDAGAERSTTIWLARNWNYLVARIEQQDRSLRIELELESAVVDGEPVTALDTDEN